MPEGEETTADHPEEVGSGPEAKKREGMELIQSQVDRLSELIQREYDAQAPHLPEEEKEFQGYVGGWAAEYQRLVQAGPEHQEEALEVLGMIRAMLGDLPIEEELLPKNIYDALRIEILSPDGEIALSQFVSRDSEEIFALIDGNRSHLSQFGDKTSNNYPTLETVRESIEHPKNPKRLRFAIRNRQGQLVGSINLTPDEDNSTQGEIGYYLGAEFQKQGYMRRAVQILTDYGFNNLGYETIYGDVTEGNVASANTLRKAGYQEIERHDGKIRYSKTKKVKLPPI